MKARRIGINFLIKATTGAAAALAMAGAAQAARWTPSEARRELVCGVSQGSAGLSIADAQGRWTGLDADLCRALAAAVLGDASKTRFVPLSSQQRFPALQSGEIDVLNRNTTITSGRDAGLGIVSAGIVFYDGQGFMVPKLGVRAPPNWTRAVVQPGTVNEQNLVDYFKKAQAVVPAGGDREPGGAGTGLLRGPLRRLPVGRVHAGRQPRRAPANRTTSSSCPNASTSRRSAPSCARTIRTGAPSCAGPSTRWWPPRNWASPTRRQPGAGARTRRCAACWARSPASARASAWTSNGRATPSGRGNYGEVWNRNLGAATPLKLSAA